MDTWENQPVKMRLPEQSFELVSVFIKASKIFVFIFLSTRQPKNFKTSLILYRPLNKYSARYWVPLKGMQKIGTPYALKYTSQGMSSLLKEKG